MPNYISTGVFKSNNLSDIVSLSLEQNFNWIELSSGIAYMPDIFELVQQTKDKINFLVHNYFPPYFDPFVLNLASTNADIHLRSMTHCRRAIDLTSDLRASFFSVHAGFGLQLKPEELGAPVSQKYVQIETGASHEVVYRIFIESIKEIADYAQSKGIWLLVENTVLDPIYNAAKGRGDLLLVTAEEMLCFFKDLDHPFVGALLDTGHAKVTANSIGFKPEVYFEKLEPYIKALHLSDNDGTRDSNQTFDEHSWFCPYIREHTKIPKVIEVYNLDAKQINNQIKVLERIIDERF